MAEITLKGNTIHTAGELPAVGTQLPDFTVTDATLQQKTLSDYAGKRKIINIFPSIDTGVCAASARKFNAEAGALHNTVVLNISRDLPFALGRFCAAEGLDNVETLSDFRQSFGKAYGVEITDGPMQGLLSRAVIVVDADNRVLYTEQVPEITQEPAYDAALRTLAEQ